jgi:microcystin-dependent protein
VQDANPFSAGQIVYIEAGDYFSVQSVNTANNSMALVNQGYPGGAPEGAVLPVGNNVSATGPQGPQGPAGVAGPAGPQGLMGVAPTGSIFMWPTPTPPGGFLVCDGSSVAISAFPNLYAVISNTFGAVDGAHFNLPPFSNGIFPVGAGANYPLAKSVTASGQRGEATHTLVTAELATHAHTATSTVSPNPHAHTASSPAHAHNLQQLIDDAQRGSDFNALKYATGGPNLSTLGTAAGVTVDPTALSVATAIANAGSGAAHNNLPPFLGINFIIKT